MMCASVFCLLILGCLYCQWNKVRGWFVSSSSLHLKKISKFVPKNYLHQKNSSVRKVSWELGKIKSHFLWQSKHCNFLLPVSNLLVESTSKTKWNFGTSGTRKRLGNSNLKFFSPFPQPVSLICRSSILLWDLSWGWGTMEISPTV